MSNYGHPFGVPPPGQPPLPYVAVTSYYPPGGQSVPPSGYGPPGIPPPNIPQHRPPMQNFPRHGMGGGPMFLQGPPPRVPPPGPLPLFSRPPPRLPVPPFPPGSLSRPPPVHHLMRPGFPPPPGPPPHGLPLPPLLPPRQTFTQPPPVRPPQGQPSPPGEQPSPPGSSATDEPSPPGQQREVEPEDLTPSVPLIPGQPLPPGLSVSSQPIRPPLPDYSVPLPDYSTPPPVRMPPSELNKSSSRIPSEHSPADDELAKRQMEFVLKCKSRKKKIPIPPPVKLVKKPVSAVTTPRVEKGIDVNVTDLVSTSSKTFNSPQDDPKSTAIQASVNKVPFGGKGLAKQQMDFVLKCMETKRVDSPGGSGSRRSRSRTRSRSRSISRGRSLSRVRSKDRKRSRSTRRSRSPYSRKRQFIERWRLNNCASRAEMKNKLEELSHMKPEEILSNEKKFWTRSAPADLYYKPLEESPNILQSTSKLEELCNKFDEELISRGKIARAEKPPYVPPPRKKKLHKHKCCNLNHDSSSESSSENESEDEGLLEELERKKAHPDRLHAELWYNDPGEMNDGPLCRCSAKAKRSGIRHNIYAGELNQEKCDITTNNSNKLYHYRITISPPTNFLIKTPTVIEHDHHEFIFEGFSMFSHKPLENLPVCKVIRFNIEYTILYIEEKLPQHFTIRELDLFFEYLFKEILELVDLDFKAAGDADGCSQFHFMPRFVRELPENGKELLSMNYVLQYLLNSSMPLISKDILEEVISYPQFQWQKLVDEVKGMVVTFPGKKPCSIRIDQLDKDQCKTDDGNVKFPEIVHFGIRPPQLSYAGNPEYQKAWREYVKFRHLLANMPKSSYEDKRKLEAKENKLQEMRTQSKMKRDVTITVSSEGFYRTGIMCDIVQHAMLLPVLVAHLRFHRSLDVLETNINYKFNNRSLLQLALTHPSYRENFGTNPDHARNSLTNCGIRQPEYGDRRIHYMNTRKRGINTLINIMSRFGKNRETESNITHNERLEFLGDAVVEFVSSIHLFHLFPRLEEGGLATYRAAIVQNQHLAILAKTLRLDGYMLYAHGSDLCHDLELRHAMANCFEALMGALFLDGGIEAADRVFGEVLFEDDQILLNVWQNYPPHPLQEEEPGGDRKWIPKYTLLQKLTGFEELIGVEFTHIRLLARAFTDRSIGFTNLTLGSNQRLEFLGDTVLQLIASEYLYKYFPEHHEGHLSLLRSSLVNNRTQAVVCDDLGMSAYAVYSNPKAELKTKDRADLLEAFLGALYVDKGLIYCQTFCNVCFFPRLHDFIMHQDWNDPKSKLQQCCLTLRTMEGGEPEIPVYKVIQCMGPTNTRLYTVAVYFKGKRLAQAKGHSIQQAEMNAAKEALDHSQSLFPQLEHQKRVIAKSTRQAPGPLKNKDQHGKKESGRSLNRSSSTSSANQRNTRSPSKPRGYRTNAKPISSNSDSASENERSSRRRRSFSYSRRFRSSSSSSNSSNESDILEKKSHVTLSTSSDSDSDNSRITCNEDTNKINSFVPAQPIRIIEEREEGECSSNSSGSRGSSPKTFLELKEDLANTYNVKSKDKN